MAKKDVYALIDQYAADFEKINDQVWEYAELCFKEFKSTKLQMDYMAAQGFRITNPAANMETCFIAEYGSGKPILGILGENDALAGQSQYADVTEAKPIIEGGNGHGCGHNLLGTGSIEAVCALKRYMEANNLPGTIRYYACPAEEGGGGKVYMTAAGVFNDLDAVATWHPMPENAVNNSALACITFNVKFTGKAAHASGEPWNGRSALDAVTLMFSGIQYLREHMLPDARIHYSILNSGGPAPNVVHHYAEAQICVRATTGDYMEELYHRVLKVAEGAAMMTGTKMEEVYILSAYKEWVKNDAMDDLIIKNLSELLPIEFTEEEVAYAKAFQPYGTKPDAPHPIDLTFYTDKNVPPKGSSDVADVSYVAPVGQASVCCNSIGAVGHGWTTTAQGKSALAHRGMHTAAKMLAGVMIDLLENPEELAKVRAQFEEARGGKTYHTLMPTDRKPGT